ncbi:MAG: photosynthetic complex assembly protein PuhC [Pseudomonadota bacterium]
MSDRANIPQPPKELVPSFLLVSVLALVLTTLALVAYASLSDRAPTAIPKPSAVTHERLISVEITSRGGALVHDMGTGALVADIAANRAGFVTGVWRALSYKRRINDVAPDLPVILQKRANGRFYLFDPETGWDFQIHGFGADNIAAFAQLLTITEN